MNILITGANGQLGNEMRLLSHQHPEHHYFFTDIVIPTESKETIYPLDITRAEEIATFVEQNAINLIVNCAAYTAVDKAEQDEQTAHLINAQAVENLGKYCPRVIHISTDYVFSGKEHQPCCEQDPVAPHTVYGKTKLEGEQLLMNVCPNAIIFRTAWLYSEYGNNFVKTMLRLGKEKEEINVVFDQIGTPTYARDLADIIFHAIDSPTWHAGIYHFTNEGVCSWYDFTKEIFRQANLTCRIRPILSKDYPYPTPRPHYSVLDKSKVKNTFGIEIPYWTDSLHQCLCRLS